MDEIKRVKSVKELSRFYTNVEYTEEKPKRDIKSASTFRNTQIISQNVRSTVHRTPPKTQYDPNTDCNLERNFLNKSIDKRLQNKAKSMTNLYQGKDFVLKDVSLYEEIRTPEDRAPPIPPPRSKSIGKFPPQKFAQKYISESEHDEPDDGRVYDGILFLNRSDVVKRFEEDVAGYQTVLAFRSSDDDEEPEGRDETKFSNFTRSRDTREDANEVVLLDGLKAKSALEIPLLKCSTIRLPVEDEAFFNNSDQRSKTITFSQSVDETKPTKSPMPQINNRSPTFMKRLSRELSKCAEITSYNNTDRENRFEVDASTSDTILALFNSDDDEESEDRDEIKSYDANRSRDTLHVTSLENRQSRVLKNANEGRFPTGLKPRNSLAISSSKSPRGRVPVEDEASFDNGDRRSKPERLSQSSDEATPTKSPQPQAKNMSLVFMNQLNRELSKRNVTKPKSCKIDVGIENRFKVDASTHDTVLALCNSDDDEETEDRDEIKSSDAHRSEDTLGITALENHQGRVLKNVDEGSFPARPKPKNSLAISLSKSPKGRVPVEDEASSDNSDRKSKIESSDETISTKSPQPQMKNMPREFMNQLGRELSRRTVTKPKSCKNDVDIEKRFEADALIYDTILALYSSDEDEEFEDKDEIKGSKPLHPKGTLDIPPLNHRQTREFEEVDEVLKVLKPKNTFEVPQLKNRNCHAPIEDEESSHNVDPRSKTIKSIRSVDETASTVSPKPQINKSLTFINQFSGELSKRTDIKPKSATLGPRLMKPEAIQKVTEDEDIAKKTDGMSKVSMVIKELIETESTCLTKMEHVIEHYVKYFRRTSISPRIEQVFGNIEKLHSAVENMYADLSICLAVDEVANVFLKHADVLDHYTEFLRNKSLSYQLATKTFAKCIKDNQMQIKDPNPLETYLLDPVQRPGRYKLLLEKLETELSKIGESSESLNEAITLISQKISKANTLLAIDSIECCPIDLMQRGSFIRKGTFNPKLEPKMVVFLFQECVIFCEQDKDKYDKYNYLNCIDMDNLSLRYCQFTKGFELSCFDKSRSEQFNKDFVFHLEASSMSTKDEWVSEIQKILWNQLQYCKDQQAGSTVKGDSFDRPEREYDVMHPDTFEHILIHGDEEYYSIENLRYSKGDKMEGEFFDKDFCLRIEVITGDIKSAQQMRMQKFSKDQAEAIAEFINSEGSHLRHIQSCIDDFYTRSEDMSSYKCLLLENIERIYNETEKLYMALLQCNSMDDIAKVFLENENLFDCHTVFLKNKSAYDCVNMELEKRLQKGKKLTTSNAQKIWSDCTIKLIGKPTYYKQFLKKMQALADKKSTLNYTLKFISAKITETITVMNLDCIQRCPIDLSNSGNFLKKGTVTLKDRCKCELFLFENILVFCVEDEHYQETYLYFDSIQIEALSVEYTRQPTEFRLQSCHLTKGGKEVKYKYDIVFPSEVIKQKWLDEIYVCMRHTAKKRRKTKTRNQNQF